MVVKRQHPNRCCLFEALFAFFTDEFSAEQKTDAPEASQTDNAIYDTAENCVLTTKDPCDKIELKNCDEAPVNRTDDGQDQCNCIHKFYLQFFWLFLYCPVCHFLFVINYT